MVWQATLARLMGGGALFTAIDYLQATGSMATAVRMLKRRYGTATFGDLWTLARFGARVISSMYPGGAPPRTIPMHLEDIVVNPFLNVPERPFKTIRYDLTLTFTDPLTGENKVLDTTVYSNVPLSTAEIEADARLMSERFRGVALDYPELAGIEHMPTVGVYVRAAQRIELTPEERRILGAT